MKLKFELHNHGFEVRAQACTPDGSEATLRELAESVLGAGCFLMHSELEEGSATAEPWHQDLKVLVEGQGWIEPTDRGVYDQLLVVRLSLDDCTFFDGALKLCPSSYKHGVLTPYEVRGHSLRPFSSPEMKAGDVLLMHPLTIHASAASTTGKRRRVLHSVFAAAGLTSLLRG